MSVDPSYMDFSGGDSSGYDPTSSWSNQYAPAPAAAPTDTSSNQDLSPIDISPALYQSKTNQLEAQHNINATDAAGSAPQGALSGALSALGSKQGSALLSAITGILGAAGHVNQSKANSKLPTMPGMGGPLPSMPGTGGSTGYGPAGGYNYKNYSGLAAGAPGTGYAPRTQSPAQPPASYYTYGQGPEQQFFQQVNPQGGAIAPVTHKRGGSIRKYAMGGMVPNNVGMMQRPMMQPGPGGMVPQGPMTQGAAMPHPAPRPMMGPGQPQPVMGRPMMMGGAGARPFAEGGQNQGALSQPSQGSRYVRGPGDGTSDDIHAKLSNGEFVVSADVVSALGNGDNNSGAKKLDELMANVRKHRAPAMAKGVLPPDSRDPHHYMRGGR